MFFPTVFYDKDDRQVRKKREQRLISSQIIEQISCHFGALSSVTRPRVGHAKPFEFRQSGASRLAWT